MSVDPTTTGSVTISQNRRSSAHAELHSIPGDYYNITDSEGTPLAGLMVLTDRKGWPVRAELHLHENTAGALYDQAVRQAQLLVVDRYSGPSHLPLIVLYARLAQDRISVPLQPPPPRTGLPAWAKPAGLALIALLVFGALGWMLNDWLGGESSSETPQTIAIAPADTPAPSAQQAAGEESAERIFETNGLATSRNALPLDLGQRVQLRPGIQGVTLRTLAGATAGDVVGYLEPPMQVTIVNGPIWLQGNTDTIVWWFVRTDSGLEAWAPANTSEFTLLEPVP